MELRNATPNVLGHERKEEDEDFSHALHLVMSSDMCMALHTANELGVFDIIAKAGEGAKLSSAEIVAQMPSNNPDAPAMLDRVLGLLACHSALSCSIVTDDNGSNVRRLYGLCPVSKYLVTNEDGVSLGSFMTLAQDKVSLDAWTHLKVSILEGGFAFNRAHGMHAYEYLGVDLRYKKVFNSAMHGQTAIVMKKILERYRGFEDLKQLVDVGGGVGSSLGQITSKYPHIKGINFDLPHVIKNAPSYPDYTEEFNIDVAGVEHVGGDMFEGVPHGDAIFMKGVLHNWIDERCLKLLKNCYKAIPSNGKVIVVDVILPVMPENSLAAKTAYAFDFVMTLSPGGKERSQQEFLALATGAGFSGIRFVCCLYIFWVMEFYK